MTQQVDILEELRAHIARKYKRQIRAAEAWGVTPAFVSLVLQGKKKPNATMLEDVGFEAVQSPVRYVRKGQAPAH